MRWSCKRSSLPEGTKQKGTWASMFDHLWNRRDKGGYTEYVVWGRFVYVCMYVLINYTVNCTRDRESS